jgi:diguanylate cyclase (GGDEF)-like protein
VHKLLAKQLARAQKASGSLDLNALVALVSTAYDEADADRRRNERSMAHMIEEVDQLNRGLEQLVDERTAELQSVRTVLEAAINNMSQGLLMFDAEARLVICNRRYLDMYALSTDRVKPGCTLRELLALRHDTGFFNEDIEEYIATLVATMRQGSDSTKLIELPDGRTIAILNHPIPGGGWVATHEDITERRRAEIKIAHMARHDGLTDLHNRMWLRERLGHALSAVHSGERLAVLYLDLDHFKSVNDTLGHPIGDELLKAVAGRLRRCVRDSDVIARIGGDEFAIVRTSLQDSQEASALAQRVCEAIRAPYDIDGHAVIVDTSVGISISPDDGVDPNELLKNADMALYGAKTDGRGTHRFFEPEMDARMKARRILELSLRGALERGEFHLNYQPLLHLGHNRVSCAEALLRWRHPERGLVSPAEFIPVAEETGLIAPLGDWVLRTACADAATWPDDVKVAVNLSPIQLMNRNLLPVVMNALAASGLPSRRLELEITEAVLLQNTERTLSTLYQLRELGVRIAMDDFGTGYSSLSYLRRFPFDKIKIDRGFIAGLPDDHESAAIVGAVAGLASNLRMATAAEGVETQAQLEKVRALGCTEMQGYLFSRPRDLPGLQQLFEPAARHQAAQRALAS